MKELSKTYFAPGRINLIGEHIDYVGGTVMPCAIHKGIRLTVSQQCGTVEEGSEHSACHEDIVVRFFSLTHREDGPQEVVLDQAGDCFKKTGTWIDYPLGVFRMFAESGYRLQRRSDNRQRLDFTYDSDLPEGAGLSSSAAIEMATALALNDLTGAGFDKLELVRLCQRAENIHIGVNCGIMDQYAIAFGKAEHAVMLDTGTLTHTHIPLKLQDAQIVLIDTNTRRELADGRYNDVRQRCARSTHPKSENDRVRRAEAAMKRGDLEALGKLLQESHGSLSQVLQVSCFELDVLVELANETAGVYGARMMGGGFGGCVLALVRKDALEAFVETLDRKYTQKTGRKATFYTDLKIGDGARVLEE